MGLHHAWEKWEMHIKFWLETLMKRDHSEDLYVDWKTLLERILRVQAVRYGQDLSDSGQSAMAGCCMWQLALELRTSCELTDRLTD